MKRSSKRREEAIYEYSTLDNRWGYSGYTDVDHDIRPPWKDMLLAIFLFIVGSVLLVVGFLIFFSIKGDVKSSSIPFFIVGLVTFIPGFYYSRIFFFILFGRRFGG